MDDTIFWSLLDRARKSSDNDQDAYSEALQDLLRKLPTADVVAFDRIMHEKIIAAYRWDLWGAAYLINGGCSDDGFEYFRRWLVSMGREVYDAALKNPDSLAKVAEEDECEFEMIVEPARAVHEEQTGNEFIEHGFPRGADAPSGEEYDFDDESQMKKRYPKIWKRVSE